MTNEGETDVKARADRMRSKGEDAVKEAREVATKAADKANAAVEDQKSTFAAQIADISEVAKTAANELRDRDQSFVADWVERTADSIQYASETLKNNDLKTIYGEVESYARRQPAVFIAGTALFGFAIARFAKVASERGNVSATDIEPATKPAAPYVGGGAHD